jgi:UDP-N-acetylglucosamine 1-carboxyvinyltransferase
MGANGVIRNSHQATITGPTPLFGTTITSLDLRAGATLIIAAIVAEGTSKIENIKLIDRGYEKIEEKFSALGAKIKRVEAGTPEALSLN